MAIKIIMLVIFFGVMIGVGVYTAGGMRPMSMDLY